MLTNDYLILTGDGIISYYVVNLATKEIIYKKTKQKELESSLPFKGRPLFRPFGVTVDEKFIYIASNEKIGVFNKFTNEFLKNLDIPAFVNTHQILIDKEKLFICHTAINCLGIHDLNTSENKFIKFPLIAFTDKIKVPDHVDQIDTVHLNSLCLHKNKLYFCLHYKGLRKSKFGFIDLKSNESKYIFEAGYHCHNVKIHGNYLFSLSTNEGKLIKYDLSANMLTSIELVDPKRVFLRGLEIYKNGLIYCGSNLYPEKRTTKEIEPFLGYFDIEKNDSIIYMTLTEPSRITDCCLIK